MTGSELKLLSDLNKRINMALQQGVSSKYLGDQVDTLISSLPDNLSDDLFMNLYRITDNLLLGGDEDD